MIIGFNYRKKYINVAKKRFKAGTAAWFIFTFTLTRRSDRAANIMLTSLNLRYFGSLSL